MKVVISIGIVLLIVGMTAGGYYLGDRSEESSTQKPSGGDQTTSDVMIDLPVTELETTAGIVTPTPNPFLTLPQTVTVVVPQAIGNELSAYRAAGEVIVAPKGWTGNGSVGANGNRTIALHPTAGSGDGRGITVYLASPGTLNAIFPAAPYNSWIREHWQELGGSNFGPVPTTAPAITAQTPHFVKYELPADEGLQTYGATFSAAQEYDGYGFFNQVEAVLPPDQHALATTVIDSFIQSTTWAQWYRGQLVLQ